MTPVNYNKKNLKSVAAPQGGREHFLRYLQYRTDCIEDLKLTPEEQQHANSFHAGDPLTPKCYSKCLLEKMNMYKDDGGFVVDEVVKHLTDKGFDAVKVRQDFDKCVEDHKDKTDKCDNAFAVAKCFMEQYRPPTTKYPSS